MNSFSFQVILFILRLMLYVDYCIIGISKLKILKLYSTYNSHFYFFTIARDVLLDSTRFKIHFFILSFYANIYRIIFYFENKS